MAAAKRGRAKRTSLSRRKPLAPLRIVICGGRASGKSTLSERLLAEIGNAPEDQRTAPGAGAKRSSAARKRGDPASPIGARKNKASRRSIAIVDIPGREQSIRGLVSSASNADVALVLVDARAGITRQTLLHSRIVALLGICEIALVVNKLDTAQYAGRVFDDIVAAYRQFAVSLGKLKVVPIPVAARGGENIATRSRKMRWHKGPSLLEYLQTLEAGNSTAGRQPFRFPVQGVSGDEADGHGLSGTVVGGSIARGDVVKLARSGLTSRVARIVAAGRDLQRTRAGEELMLVLANGAEPPPGEMIVAPAETPVITDQFAAHILWFEQAPMFPGRAYVLRTVAHEVDATITSLRHKIDPESGAEEAGHNLALNEIGFCHIATRAMVAIDPYKDNRVTGSFTLADRQSGAIVGAGMVAFALRRASNIRHQHYEVNKQARAAMKSQRPCIIWFTGLPSAGKSTVMNLVEQRLHRQGVHTYSLDGDNLRGGLTRDLGFTDADRVENIRRAGEVAKLMIDAGLIVLCAFVSPFRAERRMVRELVGEGEFIEVFVDTPLETCVARDPKGLYRKAREGRVFHVTGIDSPYEAPEQPEVHLRSETGRDADDQADKVLAELVRRAITGEH